MINKIMFPDYSKVTSASINKAQQTGGGSAFLSVLQAAKSGCTDKTLTGTALDDIFEHASDEYSVPLNLLKAVAKAESNFNPNAVSSCGAQGVMQLMPGTASSLGVQDSFDPEQNIMGGAKMLSQLLAKYNGDTKLALAAYNAGCGNVDKYGGIPPFEETQNYVERVLNLAGDGISVPISQTYSASAGGSSAVSSKYSTKTATRYTSDDYLLFLQLMVAQMKANALGRLTSNLNNYNSYNTNSLNSLSSLGSLGSSSSIADLSGLNNSLGTLRTLNALSGSGSTNSQSSESGSSSSGGAFSSSYFGF